MSIKDELKNAISINDILFLDSNKKLYSINERLEEDDNDTLLLYSISDPLSNAYEYLLKNGADISLINDEGENVIHSIVFSGDIERLKMVMNNYKVDINHQCKDGATPLLLAISLEKKEVALSLIEFGADVNISDLNDLSPLHLASQISDISLVALLVEKGANIFTKTKIGNLPLALAVNSENTEVVKFLYKKMYE